jgi:hypothetical protein
MIVLCASYLSSLIKVKWMNEMIESWKSQSHHVPLYISISIDENIKTIVNHYLEDKWKVEDLIFYVSEEKLTQFQHYQKLSNILLEKHGRNTWIMFTDDDDIWEKDRILYYKTLIDNLKKLEKENSVSHIQIPTFCVNFKDNFDSNYTIRNLEHIEAADFTHQHLDYWQFSCQLKYLIKFIEQASPVLLADGYCNIYFVKYFYNKKTPAYRWYTKDKNKFVYYWRGSAGLNRKEGTKENEDGIHLLEKLKKKCPEESIIKIYSQENSNCEMIRTKNKEHLKKYVETVSCVLKNFNNKKMKQELYEVFYGTKYDPYVNSPLLECVIE